MKSFFSRPRSWVVAAAIFLALGLAACSAMPVLQGDLEDAQSDQKAAAEAAEDGNVVRTVLFSASALATAVAYSLRKVKKQDEAPFVAKVAGRDVTFTEDELGSVVEAARASGTIKS